jgi:hypothetical protein
MFALLRRLSLFSFLAGVLVGLAVVLGIRAFQLTSESHDSKRRWHDGDTEERQVIGHVPPGTPLPNDPEEAKRLLGPRP